MSLRVNTAASPCAHSVTVLATRSARPRIRDYLTHVRPGHRHWISSQWHLDVHANSCQGRPARGNSLDVNLHDAWLAEAGSDWCHAGPLDSPHDSDAPDSVQRIMDRLSFGAQQDGSVAHGIKDPRAALFVDRWFNNAPDTVGVFVYRHYMSCLDSLRRRQADQSMCSCVSGSTGVRFFTGIAGEYRAGYRVEFGCGYRCRCQQDSRSKATCSA